MFKKISLTIAILLLSYLATSFCYAQARDNGLGQSIQIYTRFNAYVGKPVWLIVIRDLDHGINIPYFYEINRGDNFWIAFTYSRNYVVTASTLQFSPYRSNPFRSKKITNFCHLESHGRVLHGESMSVSVSGVLSPDPCTYSCHVSVFPDANFTIVSPDESE